MSQIEPRTPASREPSARLVRTQLTRILASELFSRSDRLSAFLKFIVERTLDHQGDTLKEQVIAVALYGKGPDFNTAADPIVRVDARRLRDRLREYYASAPHDDVLISVPKGSYTSVFEVNPLTAAPRGGITSPDIHAVARLAVLPFVNLTGDPNRDYLADGLADETIATLGQIDPLGLVVIGRTSMMRYKATTKSLADIGRELDADYLLESSIRTEHDRLRVITGLVRAHDQVQIWSHSFDRELTGVLELQKELSAGIAEQIRTRLALRSVVGGERHQTSNPRAYDPNRCTAWSSERFRQLSPLGSNRVAARQRPIDGFPDHSRHRSWPRISNDFLAQLCADGLVLRARANSTGAESRRVPRPVPSPAARRDSAARHRGAPENGGAFVTFLSKQWHDAVKRDANEPTASSAAATSFPE